MVDSHCRSGRGSRSKPSMLAGADHAAHVISTGLARRSQWRAVDACSRGVVVLPLGTRIGWMGSRPRWKSPKDIQEGGDALPRSREAVLANRGEFRTKVRCVGGVVQAGGVQPDDRGVGSLVIGRASRPTRPPTRQPAITDCEDPASACKRSRRTPRCSHEAARKRSPKLPAGGHQACPTGVRRLALSGGRGSTQGAVVGAAAPTIPRRDSISRRDSL